MISILTLILSLTTLSAHAQSNTFDPVPASEKYTYQQPEIPNHFDSKMDEYIFFDNNFNVVQRLRSQAKAKENLMSDEDKTPVEIKIFVADVRSIKDARFLSRFVDADDLDKVQTQDHKIYIPCLASNPIAMRLLQLKFGQPAYTTTGRKVLSRATYYVEPVGPTGGFFAKFVPNVPGFEQKLKREILSNDYIKAQTSKLPDDMRTLTMDSFMAINLSFMGVPVSVAYRSANRITENKPEHIKTYPGHALLGCDRCVESLAMQFTNHAYESAKAIDRWKTTELLPKLARYMAYTNHVLGISLESHTQNMIFDVDTVTGKISHIYFRDFADDLLSPLALLGDSGLPQDIDWQQVKLLSVHSNFFSDPDTQQIKTIIKGAKSIYKQKSLFSQASIDAMTVLWQQIKQLPTDNNSEDASMNNQARDIWFHASIYSGQGITSHITGFQKQQRHLKIFLDAYIQETEQIIREKIILSEDAQKVMQQLEQKVARQNFYSGELNGRSPLRNAMASVLKPIFEQVFAMQIQKIQSSLQHKPAAPGQLELSKKMQHAIDTQRVVYLSDEAKLKLSEPESTLSWYKKTLKAYVDLNPFKKPMPRSIVVKIHDNRMWAVESLSGKVLAVSIDPIVPMVGKTSEAQRYNNTFILQEKLVYQCLKIY